MEVDSFIFRISRSESVLVSISCDHAKPGRKAFLCAGGTTMKIIDYVG